MEWIPLQLADYGLAGVIILALLGLIAFQQRNINVQRKEYVQLVKESADRQERLTKEYSDSIKENTQVTTELTQYLKQLNGNGKG